MLRRQAGAADVLEPPRPCSRPASQPRRARATPWQAMRAALADLERATLEPSPADGAGRGRAGAAAAQVVSSLDPELPRAGAELRRRPDRGERRASPRRPRGAPGSTGCWAASRPGLAGTADGGPASGPAPRRAQLAVAAQQPARRGRARRSRSSSPTSAASSTASGSCSERSRCFARTRSAPGRTSLRALAGTAIGFVVGGALVYADRNRHGACCGRCCRSSS